MTTPTLIRCQCGEMLIDDGGNSHYEGTRWLHYLTPDEKGGDPTEGRADRNIAVRTDATPGAGATKHAPVPERSEKEIQAAIVRTVEMLGGTVYDLSQPRATKQTPGLPDLLVFHGERWTWAEVKRHDGSLTGAQKTFRDRCMAVGAPWELWRSESDALAWHERRGAA